MGIFDFFKKNKKPDLEQHWASMLNGYTPIFSQFGQDIYASDVVQQAISCIVFEMKKLKPQHIRQSGSDPIPMNSDIQKLLDDPNPLMTTSDFLEKVFWQLFLNYNSFIIPTYDITTDAAGNRVKKYTGLWPVQPTQVDFLQDKSDQLFVKLTFANNYHTTLRYSDVIHIKYRFSVNEYMGGNVSGQPDNGALLKTLQLNDTLLQGVAKALRSSFAINGVIKYNTLLDDGKMDKNIKELESKIAQSESGFLPLDIKGEFIPFNNKTQLVDEATLQFVDSKILRHFGVSLPILTGDYTKEQYEAFYQKTLEPLIISIAQSFTKVLFTSRERAFGNKIQFYEKELIFMTTDQKISLFDMLVDTASCYKNELRTAFGMRPLAELEGQLAMSSNKTNAENNKDDPSDQNDDSNINDQESEENAPDDQSGDESNVSDGGDDNE